MDYEITFEEISEMPSEKISHFPVVIFGFAVIKDFILDPLVLAVTLVLFPVGWLLGIMVSMTFGLVLFVWMINKSSFIQRRIWTWFIRTVFIAILVSFFPLVRFIVPEYTILVLLAHHKETKLVRKFNKLLEQNIPIS